MIIHKLQRFHWDTVDFFAQNLAFQDSASYSLSSPQDLYSMILMMLLCNTESFACQRCLMASYPFQMEICRKKKEAGTQNESNFIVKQELNFCNVIQTRFVLYTPLRSRPIQYWFNLGESLQNNITGYSQLHTLHFVS